MKNVMCKARQDLVLLTLLSLLLSTTCNALQITPPPETPVPGLIDTLAAQTMQADPQMAELLHPPTLAPATNTSMPTSTPLPLVTWEASRTPLPTLTLIPGSPFTETLGAEPTPVILPDGTEVPCNGAEWISDVTIPDGTPIKLNTEFTKVWEIKNAGVCTWTEDYLLVLVWGNPMGTDPPIPLRRTVKPGETVQVSINMVSPYIPACWQSNWMLQDKHGHRFGVGYKYGVALYVLISVFVPGVGFTKHFCD
jgi:hypothetical protein